MSKSNKIEQRVKWEGFPVTDLSEFKDVVIPPEVEEAKTRMYEEHLGPYHIPIPDYAMKWIYRAALATGSEREEMLEKARQRMEQHKLSKWAKREISVDDDDKSPMPDDVKQHLKELNKQRREEAKTQKEAFKKADTNLAQSEQEKPKRSKIPVFQDPETQKLILAKRPWVVPGSFTQDPEKAGGTNVLIQCQTPGCEEKRQIHLADSFQVKYCHKCKANKR